MPDEGCSPEALVDRIRNGDPAAETELVRRFSRPLMTMLRHRTGDIQHAEDLHQDTFVVVLQRLRAGGIEDPARLSAFLHKTALNLLIGDYRKQSRRKTHADTDLVQREADHDSDQLGNLIRAESDRAVRAMIQELPNPRDRELLYRFYILQQEKPIVCQALGLSTEHFDRVISRARGRFRQLISERPTANGVIQSADGAPEPRETGRR